MAKAKQPFAIELPSDWEDQTTYVFYGPKVDEQQHFLQMIITRHLQAEDIEEVAEDQTEPILRMRRFRAGVIRCGSLCTSGYRVRMRL